MENRYQGRLRRNQASIVKEIAVKVQEVIQDVVREMAQEVIQEIVQNENNRSFNKPSNKKGSTKARSAKTWPLNSYNCKESQNVVALFVCIEQG